MKHISDFEQIVRHWTRSPGLYFVPHGETLIDFLGASILWIGRDERPLYQAMRTSLGTRLYETARFNLPISLLIRTRRRIVRFVRTIIFLE